MEITEDVALARLEACNEYVSRIMNYEGTKAMVCLDGNFEVEEIEAILWCLKNDKWTKD